MNQGELRQLILRRLNDYSGGADLFGTSADAHEAIRQELNLAQIRLTHRLVAAGYYHKVTSGTITISSASVTEYEIPNTFSEYAANPANYQPLINVLQVTLTSVDPKLDVVFPNAGDFRELTPLIESYKNLDAGIAQPLAYMLGDKIGFITKLKVNEAYRVRYVPEPKPLATGDMEVPEVPGRFSQLLVEYVVLELLDAENSNRPLIEQKIARLERELVNTVRHRRLNTGPKLLPYNSRIRTHRRQPAVGVSLWP